MLSKNESFKPPEQHEKWINSEFSNVLDYLSEKNVRFNGAVFVKWLAIPFISIWAAKSTEFQDKTIWIMHNLDFTDYILSDNLDNSREALFAFAKKWSEPFHYTLRCRNGNDDKLMNHKQMLLNVGNDEELWRDPC